MHGMGGSGGMGGMGGMDAGDVQYPMYLVNGRAPSDPDTLAARPGDRVRLRIINASADTVFTVALGGHDLTVTHTDGYPVQAVTASTLRIGMGERYDATVTLADGVFALVAEPVGKRGLARALVRTGSGAAPGEHGSPERARCVPAHRGRPASGRLRATTRTRTGLGAGPAAVGVHGALRVDHQRPHLRRHRAADHPRRRSRPASHPEHVDDVAPAARPRPHLPARPRRWRGTAQGHRPGARPWVVSASTLPPRTRGRGWCTATTPTTPTPG